MTGPAATEPGKAPRPTPKPASAASTPMAMRIVVGIAVAIGAGLLGIVLIAVMRSSRSGHDRDRRTIPATTPSTTPATDRIRPGMPEVESHIFQVAEATGRVEAQRNGKWVLIESGDVLTQDDLVRTGIGRAILKLGGNTEIELRDRVEIRLDSISRAGASVDLRRGRVVAHVTRTGGNVAITAARTRTANEGGAPARFIVTADERGRVAVATTEGAVRFESAGRVVNVAAGTVARADPGQPPVDPERISEDIFLTVAWPTGDRREDRLPITGRAEPGSVVRVNGTEASVDGKGRFVASVPMRAGANAVEVEVEDVAGRNKREAREFRRIPTQAPALAPVPTELWKK